MNLNIDHIGTATNIENILPSGDRNIFIQHFVASRKSSFRREHFRPAIQLISALIIIDAVDIVNIYIPTESAHRIVD